MPFRELRKMIKLRIDSVGSILKSFIAFPVQQQPSDARPRFYRHWMMVESRCAITITVLLTMAFSRAFLINSSDSVSSVDVASSRSNIGASLISVRAIESVVFAFQKDRSHFRIVAYHRLFEV